MRMASTVRTCSRCGEEFIPVQGQLVCPDCRATVKRVALGDPLTPREKQMVQLLYGGWSNQQLADRLHLTRGTIKERLSDVFKKLGVHSRCEIMARRIAELESMVGGKAA